MFFAVFVENILVIEHVAGGGQSENCAQIGEE